jgi:hypothetical protein
MLSVLKIGTFLVVLCNKGLLKVFVMYFNFLRHEKVPGKSDSVYVMSGFRRGVN